MEPSPHANASLTDEEIVRRVRGGEPALFEVLMRRYNQRLYRVARAILGSDAEVEDVMQEAYLRAYAHLGQFAGRSRFSTWLTRIAAHAAAARGRQTTCDLFATYDDVAAAALSGASGGGSRPPREDADPGAIDPERRLLQGEVRALLEQALDRLTPDTRSVFVLREVEGLDTAETAEALGVSEEAVRTRLLRARAMLRRDLSRAGIETAAAYRLHLERCDRVVGGVLPHLIPAA